MSLSDAPPRARHLLIVDDDDRIRELLKEYLTRAGFRVTAAPGGAAARRLFATFDFDLAVLDVMMPGEDGFSLARWLREQRGPSGRTPVLMLTARTEPADRIEGLKLGADDYLGKPFEPRELVLRIRALLRRSTCNVTSMCPRLRRSFRRRRSCISSASQYDGRRM